MVDAQVAFMKDLEHRYQEVSGLQDRSAYKIFYGPVRPAPVMVLGINPGGDRGTQRNWCGSPDCPGRPRLAVQLDLPTV